MTREMSFFISYARENSALATELAGHLRKFGAEVRLDVQEVRVGDDYVARLSAAVLAADFAVPIISEAWLKSRWCHQELSLAMARQLQRDGRARVLPWRLGNVALPATLTATHCPRIDPANLHEMARVLVADARDHLSCCGTACQW